MAQRKRKKISTCSRQFLLEVSLMTASFEEERNVCKLRVRGFLFKKDGYTDSLEFLHVCFLFFLFFNGV